MAGSVEVNEAPFTYGSRLQITPDATGVIESFLCGQVWDHQLLSGSGDWGSRQISVPHFTSERLP